ncbi:hypothetical protein J4427_00310 [Candidatus Woesearchaeota archaeon]|nr:hypothetical protein [Candidatus Woesearchaeota archaeon]
MSNKTKRGIEILIIGIILFISIIPLIHADDTGVGQDIKRRRNKIAE